MNAQQYQMMQILQKIPVFKGFEVKESLMLLRICHPQSYKAGQTIFNVGESSTEMLVLYKGRVQVVSRSGEVLAHLGTGAATGEMGIFTGQPRSASVVATEPTGGLIIRKAELIVLLGNNPSMHLRLLYNVINLLSARLADANRQNDTYARKLEALAGPPLSPVGDDADAADDEAQLSDDDEEAGPPAEDDHDLKGLGYDGSHRR